MFAIEDGNKFFNDWYKESMIVKFITFAGKFFYRNSFSISEIMPNFFVDFSM